MRDSLKSTAGWLWLLALLALPDCTLDRRGLARPTVFNPGPQPQSSVIFCDIENSSVARRCATATDLAVGVPLARAAVALVRQESNTVGLDFSPAAIAAQGCSPGTPVAITFRGGFPDGVAACLNCGAVIPSVYADPTAACVDRCRDLNVAGSDAFCADTTHAHASTNAGSCFADACTNEGALRTDFVDPRRTPEPVIWVDRVGVGVSGPDSNTLTRTAAATGNFDAGAASSQTFTRGDGYVEFTVSETNRARVLGLSSGAPPDGDPSLMDIGFGARLSTDGHLFVFESNALVPGPNPDMSFATYAAGDRVRVTLSDNLDGTADVAYRVIPAACGGPECDGMLLRSAGPAPYPFRVDATLRELDATLTNVRIVRIR